MATNDLSLCYRVEEAGLNALPPLHQVLLNGWLLRFADGYTRRANSANPFCADLDHDMDAHTRACAALYAAQGLPCLFRIPSFRPSNLDAALDVHGCSPPEGETRVVFRPRLDGLDLDRDDAETPGVEVAERQPGAEWLDTQARIAGNTARVAQVRRDMLSGLAIPAAFGAVRPDGVGTPMVSVAYAAVHDGLACINMVATDPAARRRGLSRQVIRRLLSWARTLGAEGACLQVAADNEAALPLYDGLGFHIELYRYHYRRLGTG